MAQEDMTIDKLQELACTSTLKGFKELLERYAEAESEDVDDAGNPVSGLQFMTAAIEKEGITSERKDGTKQFTPMDVEEREEKIEAIAAFNNKGHELEDVKNEVRSLREEFKQSITRLEEELAERDATIAELKVKLERTEALAIAAGKRAGELTPKVKTLEDDVKTLKKRSLSPLSQNKP